MKKKPEKKEEESSRKNGSGVASQFEPSRGTEEAVSAPKQKRPLAQPSDAENNPARTNQKSNGKKKQ